MLLPANLDGRFLQYVESKGQRVRTRFECVCVLACIRAYTCTCACMCAHVACNCKALFQSSLLPQTCQTHALAETRMTTQALPNEHMRTQTSRMHSFCRSMRLTTVAAHALLSPKYTFDHCHSMYIACRSTPLTTVTACALLLQKHTFDHCHND